jgi:hypothetical protein
MARNKHSSPTLNIVITEEQHAKAIASNSGGCLIADAIKEQYPQLTSVSVDMATVRATDRQKGERYTYLTPAGAQHLLLAFDQGWPHVGAGTLTIRRAVKITPIIRGRQERKRINRRREDRVRELEAKEASGEPLSRYERTALTRMHNAAPAPERPTSVGAPDVKVDERGVVVRGGNPVVQGPAHPNLLRGRNRHFGAKLADPGTAFQEAVDAAVAERLTPQLVPDEVGMTSAP